MDTFEPATVSFVVKIWLEEPASGTDRSVWRGRVVHVGSGDQRYFTQLQQVIDFIRPYVETMGVESEPE